MTTVNLSTAARIVAAYYGPCYNCEVYGKTCSVRCRITKDVYNGISVFRSDILYEGSTWWEVLSKAIPYFAAEYDPNGTATLSDYCGRLTDRRKAKESSERHRRHRLQSDDDEL